MLLKHFVSLTIFRKKFGFEVQLSLAVFVCILSSKGAVASALYKDFEKYPRKIFLLKLRSSNVFP